MSTARRIYRPTIACVLLTLAMTSAAAASEPRQDLRNPDNRTIEAALAQERYYSSHGTANARDQRSQDERDASAGRGTLNAADVISTPIFTDRERATVERFKRSPSYREALREAAAVVKPPQLAPARSDDGIDWGDAGIGAGSLLGVIALGLAGAMTILHRRRRGRRTATAA